jgi:hypothetical protein
MPLFEKYSDPPAVLETIHSADMAGAALAARFLMSISRNCSRDAKIELKSLLELLLLLELTL